MWEAFLLVVFLQTLLLVQSSEIKEPVSLAVTVYNDQFAIVKDVRTIEFDQGRSDLYFTDVSANIQTSTVTFKALTNPEGVKVFQQNFEANLINTQAILKKYINQQIQLYARLGETSTKVNGILLGYQDGVILKTDSGIEVFNNLDGIKFAKLPDGFLTVPTLHWKVFSSQAITSNCEVAYRTTGFSWQADYILILAQNQTEADFNGWVTIQNHSGKRYQDAKLKLIAGDVNVVSSGKMFKNSFQVEDMAADGFDGAAAPPSFSEKSFSDFHLYTLSQPVTLEENSQKQVEFVPKVFGIDVRKYNYLMINAGGYSQMNLKASNKLEIQNSGANKLGMPLPKGTVRVFKEDEEDSSLEFLGEDGIEHTPRDENITLNTGSAFDIAADKIATNRQSFQNGGFSAESNLTIWNHKTIQAEIVIELNNYYADNNRFAWKAADLNVEKVSAQLFRIRRVFAANEKFSILWSEEYRR